MNIFKQIKLILILMLVVSFFYQTADARMVRDKINSDFFTEEKLINIISAVDKHLGKGEYDAVRNVIYESFPQLIEFLYGVDIRGFKDEKTREMFYQGLENPNYSVLFKMINALWLMSDEFLNKFGSNIFFYESMKVRFVKFGYLCSALFAAELEKGNLNHNTITNLVPDFYHYICCIDSRLFMFEYTRGSDISGQLHQYKSKTQTILTESLQRHLSKYLEPETFNLNGLEHIMDKDRLREYAYYQTIGTVLLNLKGFRLPQFSQRIDAKENLDGVNIVFGSILGADSLAVLREGSRYPEANFIFTPHVNWLDLNEDNRVVINKGYLYTEDGLFFMEFEQPLEVHYFLNNFVGYSDRVYELLERSIDRFGIPTPRCKEIGELTSNKSASMRLLYESGINVPRGSSFFGLLSTSASQDSIEYVAGDNLEDRYKIEESVRYIEMAVEDFMYRYEIDEIVVKPYNTDGGKGIAYFTRQEINQAAQYIKELIIKHSGVRYEERIYPPKIEAAGNLYDWNLRVFLSRDSDNNWVVSDIAVRYGEGVVNISKGAETMAWQRLMFLLDMPGSHAIFLKEKIEEVTVKAVKTIENKVLKTFEVTGQEDFMSADVIFDEYLTPYIMEINNHNSGAMWNLDAAGGEMGRSSRDWVLTMIRRGQEYKDMLSNEN